MFAICMQKTENLTSVLDDTPKTGASQIHPVGLIILSPRTTTGLYLLGGPKKTCPPIDIKQRMHLAPNMRMNKKKQLDN